MFCSAVATFLVIFTVRLAGHKFSFAREFFSERLQKQIMFLERAWNWEKFKTNYSVLRGTYWTAGKDRCFSCVCDTERQLQEKMLMQWNRKTFLSVAVLPRFCYTAATVSPLKIWNFCKLCQTLSWVLCMCSLPTRRERDNIEERVSYRKNLLCWQINSRSNKDSLLSLFLASTYARKPTELPLTAPD